MYPIFDETFIHDSYSCREDRGTHKAVYRFEKFARAVSKNYTQPCFVLKCDVKKFFASVNHDILMRLIKKKVKDEDTLQLVGAIIDSFGEAIPQKNNSQMSFDILAPIGMPIGNLTSQLFANIYLNELDQFVKNELKIKHYIRYCDDFVFLSTDIDDLKYIRSKAESFLRSELRLELHPNKVSIEKMSKGVDFLGYVTLPHHRLLRTKTKKRMLKRVSKRNLDSYHGIMKHCNGYGLEKKVKKIVADQELKKKGPRL
jgi:retron-type reverse transcriptase